MKTRLPMIIIALALQTAYSAEPVKMYLSEDELPTTCILLAPVKASESYKKNTPESNLSGTELISRVFMQCQSKAHELGGNSLLKTGHSSFHGADFFGYTCNGIAYKC
ncbi:MAG: hypothetical protein ACRDBQ_25315 [Shewanella sp.]